MPFVITPDAGTKITVQLDPDDPDSTVELTLAGRLTIVENSGPTFQRYNYVFNNDGPSSRVVAIREITHKKRLPGMEWRGGGKPLAFVSDEDDEDDDNQKIKTEVIVALTTQSGSGKDFDRSIYRCDPANFLKWRKGHIKRIFGKNKDGSKDPDRWLDIFRKDQFVSFDGAGPNYQCQLITVAWPDAEDDNPFDTNDLRALPAPTDLSAAYGLDFLQDIVNLNGGSPLLVFSFENTWAGGPDQGQADAQLSTPAAPKAKPPVTKHGNGDPDFLFLLGAYFSVDGVTPPVKNPVTPEMTKHLLAWTLPVFHSAGPDSGTWRFNTFVNLSRLKTKAASTPGSTAQPIKPYTLTFTVSIPPVPEQINLYNFTISGLIPVPPPAHDVPIFEVLQFPLVASKVDETVAQLLSQLALRGANDPSVIVEQITFIPQTSGGWTLTTAIYGGRRDFTQDASSIPQWSTDSARALNVQSESNGRTTRTLTFKIAVPGLTMAVSG